MKTTHATRTKAISVATISLAAAFLLGIGTASAALIAEDSFDYSENGLGTNGTSGNGWSGGWSDGSGGEADGSVTSPGFDYNDGTNSLVTAGNKANLVGTETETAVAFRELSSPQSVSAGNPLWTSIIMQRNDSADNDRAFLFAFLNGSSDVIFTVGQNNFDSSEKTARPWRIYFKVSDDDAEIAGTDTTEMAFLLVKMSTDGTTTDTLELFLNPDLSSEPTTADATVTSANGNLTDLAKIRFFAGADSAGFDAAADADFDEFRLGTTFADVTPIPEPTSFLLLALGGMVLLKRRVS